MFAQAFRVFVLLVLAAHVFYMYSFARHNVGLFGFDAGTTAMACSFALMMLLPLVWAVTLPELPEIYVTHIRARRWWRRGRCPVCGYLVSGLPHSTCPECGSTLGQPRGYEINRKTVRRFIVINLVAWALGCFGAEVWAGIDEITFRQAATQAQRAGKRSYHRPAAWPADGLLDWWDDDGFTRNSRRWRIEHSTQMSTVD